MSLAPSEKALRFLDNLRPITSLSNGRYDKRSFATPGSVVLAPGFQNPMYDVISHACHIAYSDRILPLNRPHYLPSQWTAHIHPEGQLYFHRNSTLRVTTDAYLYNPEVLDLVILWVKTIEARIEANNLPLSPSIELFLLIENTGCAYYFIDHASRSQFWLEAIPSEELNIPDVDSPSHLSEFFCHSPCAMFTHPRQGLYLEYLYWTHVEHFPMHFGGLPVKVVQDLLCVFSHALTDQITSQTSTFFYTQDECAKFIKILKLARDNSFDGHQVCVVARLWSQVCSNRFLTHYGQANSRLNRDQAIIYDSPRASSWVSAVARRTTFHASDAYLAKLNELFVDRLVYFNQWQSFIRRCRHGWRTSFWTAFAILSLHGFLFFVQSEPLLVIASASLAATSLFTSLILLYRYDRLESDDACAYDVYEHLSALQSTKYNFQFVALSFALPNALQIWALIFLALNSLLVLSNFVGIFCAASCGLFVALVLFSLLRITSERSWDGLRLPQAFRREKMEHDLV
ncbi:hypothetical protein FB446DRAFT_417049 [Lentinula raphanica]|nr:hypothetical protein FB446DRAFT_417049 [Lentinula raphanica]